MVAEPNPEAVLSALLELGDDFWDMDSTLMTEFFRLLEEEPHVLAAGLVHEAREGRPERADRVIRRVCDLSDGALIRAVSALDPPLARRWAAQCLFSLEECVETLGATEAAALVREAMVSEDADRPWWIDTANGDLWRMPPRRIWQFFFGFHDGSREDGVYPLGEETDWLLLGAPEAIFESDPQRALTPEEEALLESHVDAFADMLLSAVAAGIDPRPWLRWIDSRLDRCPSRDCCRPSLFVVAMLDRGWFEGDPGPRRV